MIAESYLLPALPAVPTRVFHPGWQPGRVVAPAGDESSRVADRLGLGDDVTQAVIGPVRAAGGIVHGDTLAERAVVVFLVFMIIYIAAILFE